MYHPTPHKGPTHRWDGPARNLEKHAFFQPCIVAKWLVSLPIFAGSVVRSFININMLAETNSPLSIGALYLEVEGTVMDKEEVSVIEGYCALSMGRGGVVWVSVICVYVLFRVSCWLPPSWKKYSPPLTIKSLPW